MARRRWPVERLVLLRVESPAYGWPIWTTWGYAGAADPWAVHVDLGGGNVWTFSRGLLACGLHHPAGLGDVQVFPYRDRIAVGLESPDGRCLATARRVDLETFLAATYRLVPKGREAEHLDVDAAVARVLEEAERC